MGVMVIRGYKLRRIWPSVIVIALACLLILPSTAGQMEDIDDGRAIDRPAAPNPIPILSLSLFPTQLQAKVTADQLGAVTFGGNATVDQLFFLSSTLTMTAVVNAGWPIVLSPQTIKFTGSGTERFTVTVIVPPGTSALMTGNVIVTGSLKAPFLSPVVASAGAVVTVGAYYDIYVESANPAISLSPGESGEVTFQVWNRGNSIATVSANVESSPKHVEFEFSDEYLVINSEESENLTVKITATDSAARGGHEVLIYFNLAEGQSVNGSYDSVFSITLQIPTLAAEIGYPVIAGLVVVACIGVAVFILWKKGMMSRLKDMKLPKRTKTEV